METLHQEIFGSLAKLTKDMTIFIFIQTFTNPDISGENISILISRIFQQISGNQQSTIFENQSPCYIPHIFGRFFSLKKRKENAFIGLKIFPTKSQPSINNFLI
jgi:hypothetical protein